MQSDRIFLEHTLTLAEASRNIPGKPSVTSLWRWCRHGLRGVRLEYARVGRQFITSREALGRFSDALVERDRIRVPSPTPNPQKRSSRHERAEAEAVRAGL